jgi:hypothetical protein
MDELHGGEVPMEQVVYAIDIPWLYVYERVILNHESSLCDFYRMPHNGATIVWVVKTNYVS